MPVEDHGVHPSTRIGPEHRAGCWVGPDGVSQRKPYYWAKAEWEVTAHGKRFCSSTQVFRLQKDHMSKQCRQIDHDKLPECQGCCAEKDHEYINKMRAMK